MPEFEIAKQDKSISQHNGYEPWINAFQGLYAPIQYFCRLRDNGLDKWMALDLSEQYKRNVYNPIMKQINEQNGKKEET